MHKYLYSFLQTLHDQLLLIGNTRFKNKMIPTLSARKADTTIQKETEP